MTSRDARFRYDLANMGEAVGDPSRAAMLVALMGGVALPAAELARAAGVAPSTASEHLHRLTAAGLVVVRAQGRHRYFELAGPQVADAVERLATLAARTVPRPRRVPDEALAFARTCYAHLAGRVAVAFWAHARERAWVEWTDAAVTLLPRGQAALARRGLLADAALPIAGGACLDWSERVPHVSGRLGVALKDALLARGWVKSRRPEKEGESTRALRLTVKGEEGFAGLGVRW
jgi:DNA-binding transcriptional ArsR family regulator